MTNPQSFRKKELKICPTPNCGHTRMAYAEAKDLCPRCQSNARQQAYRDKKKKNENNVQTQSESLSADLIQHQDLYKQALKTKDETVLLHEKAYLTAAATSALLGQDAEAMRCVRACFADLASLADRFDSTGKPGDRWRTLSDVLSLVLESGRPLEQLRLALPSTVSGLIMKQLKEQPGITPTVLSQSSGITKKHINNEIKKLESAGMIHRFERDKNDEIFLTEIGRKALESIESVIPGNK